MKFGLVVKPPLKTAVDPKGDSRYRTSPTLKAQPKAGQKKGLFGTWASSCRSEICHQHQPSQRSTYNQAGRCPTSHQGFQALLDKFISIHSNYFFFFHGKITIYNRNSYFNVLKRGENVSSGTNFQLLYTQCVKLQQKQKITPVKKHHEGKKQKQPRTERASSYNKRDEETIPFANNLCLEGECFLTARCLR